MSKYRDHDGWDDHWDEDDEDSTHTGWNKEWSPDEKQITFIRYAGHSSWTMLFVFIAGMVMGYLFGINGR